jgi:phosphate transport system permease protein
MKRQNCISNRISNIITGLILSIGRVSGETAPILFTVAAIFYLNCLLHFRSSDALPYHLYVISPAVLILKIKSDGLWYSTCIDYYVLISNLLANALRKYYGKKVK